ncbi:Cyanovirin-N [Chaetomium tenue]|uniref:Cyanovirin-N n=1 Tax=Chaetomium tenue TaxID=1854479 RepID=A0ACB7PM88_9PEZI|nr:Cyanovirin-N [Chaetomium globosum]
MHDSCCLPSQLDISTSHMDKSTRNVVYKAESMWLVLVPVSQLPSHSLKHISLSSPQHSAQQAYPPPTSVQPSVAKMKYFVALLMGLSLLPQLALAAVGGGFYASCKHNWSMDGKYMIAECRKTNGQYMRTRQDMNLCITNFNGILAPANNGYFYNTCRGCGQAPDGLVTANSPPTSRMGCFCKGKTGGYDVDSSVDLNDFVENRDGYMFCFGHRSAPY